MVTRIKECPFCGTVPDKNNVNIGGNPEYGFYVFMFCFSCGTSGPWQQIPEDTDLMHLTDTEKNAARALWNKRWENEISDGLWDEVIFLLDQTDFPWGDFSSNAIKPVHISNHIEKTIHNLKMDIKQLQADKDVLGEPGE